ncbi:hypothetical protein G6F35_014070 [Rhizopus arrhizus]|nr:hypothetical protein G6F35_014070 [Rhizopus arrhizus]
MRDHGGDQTRCARYDEGRHVAALRFADGAGHPRGGGRAQLVARDDPAEDDCRIAFAERFRREAQRGRHRGDPVQAEEDREDRQAVEREIGIGQVDQRQAAQRVVDEEQLARGVAGGQPTRGRGAHQVEDAHDRQQAGCLDFQHAVVAAKRDQVRADQAVGGEAADEEGREQEPERAGLGGARQGAEGGGDHAGARCGGSGRRVRIAAERHQTDAGRAVGHQPPGQRHQRGGGGGHRPDHAGPVAGGSQRPLPDHDAW